MIDQQEKRDSVIESVVSTFIETARPVSSAHVARTCGLDLSPASIRSIMKELEDDGFLKQPHTSAGRLPTIKCYRYYVKYIMPGIAAGDSVLHEAKSLVENVLREHDAEMFMGHIAKVLSEVTDLIGVAMSPSFERGIFDRLEIISMGGSTYLVVISLKSGIVKTINLAVDRIIPRTKIHETGRYITERLHGLTIADIKKTIGSRLQGASSGDKSLFDVILNNRKDIFNFADDNILHISGLSRLLGHPEFAPADSTLKLVDLFEHKNEIAKVLDHTVYRDDDVNIHIGGSGPWGSTPPLSLVSAVYRMENASGVVAVIGPVRIHYPRLSAIVRYTAEVASSYFSQS